MQSMALQAHFASCKINLTVALLSPHRLLATTHEAIWCGNCVQLQLQEMGLSPGGKALYVAPEVRNNLAVCVPLRPVDLQRGFAERKN